jgi:hypothetical protein
MITFLSFSHFFFSMDEGTGSPKIRISQVLGLAGGAAWFGPVSSAFKFMFSLPHLAA